MTNTIFPTGSIEALASYIDSHHSKLLRHKDSLPCPLCPSSGQKMAPQIAVEEPLDVLLSALESNINQAWALSYLKKLGPLGDGPLHKRINNNNKTHQAGMRFVKERLRLKNDALYCFKSAIYNLSVFEVGNYGSYASVLAWEDIKYA